MAETIFGRRAAAAGAAGAALLGVLLVSGCALLGVRGQREALQSFARIRGTVTLDVPSDSPLVVVLGRAADDPKAIDPETGRRTGNVIDHFRLEHAGTFAFAVMPGTFRLAAFADENRNLIYDPGEPALAGQPDFTLSPGEKRDDFELVIHHDVHLDERYDIVDMQARAPKDQENFSLGRFTVKGEVVDLDDPKFGEANGKLGMWKFVDFLYDVGPGVYFLEEYDPNKIPVLFVHGISGYPQQFSTLIAKLDRKHFQPWFYFYPSGIHLDGIANHLTDVMTDLQLRYGFDELAVVAHSMGGLVSRAFILKYQETTGRPDIRLFVAISSPWGGSESASHIGDAPKDLVVYSWLDMNPSSDFLKGLFYQPPDYLRPRPLPPQTPFYMMFGYKRKESSFGPSGDGVLTTKSETRLEAVEAAKSILPLDYDHVAILHSPEAVKRLNAILAKRFD